MERRLIIDRNGLIRHAVFACLMLLTGAFIFWKCRYGFGNVDESFYITVPYRLFKGDALFLEEWHLSQMAGVLTWPIVSLYIILKGSTDGIILAMRYVCALVQCLIAVFLYFRLKKLSWFGAVAASISFALYIPFGIMALSYNSMGIMALLIALVIALTADKHKTLQYITAGLFYAAAVLCCPYLACVFVIYLLFVAIRALVVKFRKRDIKADTDVWSVKGALSVTAGAAIAAVAFLVFVLSRASLTEILQAFPQILNDPEHPAIPFAAHFSSFFRRIFKSNAAAPYVYSALGALALVCIIDWRRSRRRALYFSVAAVCVLVQMLSYYKLNHYINHLMWSLNVLAIFPAVLTEEKIIRRVFCTIWLPGILYAFCLNMTSNQGFYAISSASAVATVGSILITVLFGRELLRSIYLRPIRYAAAGLIGILMVVQLGTQTVLRYNSVFWEKDMASQVNLIEEGIDAGLYVTDSKLREYENAQDNLGILETYGTEKVLFLSKKTWYYLATEYEMCTYSAWIAGVTEHSISRLEAYYALNPDKLPDAVFVDKVYKEQGVLFCEKMGYEMEQVTGGYLLTK